MRAAVYHEPGDIRIEDIAEPSPGPGEVKLKVAFNGVCGSDLHEYYNAATFVPTEPHPQTGIAAPVVLGHEFSGTVVEVGDGVTSVEVGTRVAVRPTLSCRQCESCRRGLFNICRSLAFHGLSAATGGLSEFTVVGADAVHPLPASVSLELGALVEPMAVGHHAVTLSGLEPGDLTVVAGLGPIGIGLWFALQAAGITDVVVSDPSPERRAALTRLGAENVIDPREDDVRSVAFDLTGGAGAPVVFDAAGVGAAISSGLDALAPRGKVVVVGIHEKAMELNPTSLLLGETSIVGSIVYLDEDYTAVIQAMADGHYATGGWVSHNTLDGLLDAYTDLRAGRQMKILIDL